MAALKKGSLFGLVVVAGVAAIALFFFWSKSNVSQDERSLRALLERELGHQTSPRLECSQGAGQFKDYYIRKISTPKEYMTPDAQAAGVYESNYKMMMDDLEVRNVVTELASSRVVYCSASIFSKQGSASMRGSYSLKITDDGKVLFESNLHLFRRE